MNLEVRGERLAQQANKGQESAGSIISQVFVPKTTAEQQGYC